MGFSTNSYAKIWKIENKGKYSVVELSVSHKSKDENGNELKDGNGKTVYEIEFRDRFVRFVGKAHNLAQSLKSGDSIKILNCDVTNKYDAEKKVTYTNYVVFDAEASGYNNSNRSGVTSNHTNQNNASSNNDFMNIPDDACEEGLPFN